MSKNKKALYNTLTEQIKALIENERNYIANTANISVFMFEELNRFKPNSVNWFGFYFIDTKNTNDLVLGPFAGKVACTRIKIGEGVCGTTIKQQNTIIVPDVHKFEGHIACDTASNSEICVPLRNSKGKVIGLIDVDSPNFNNFDQDDKEGLEEIAKVIEKGCDFFDI